MALNTSKCNHLTPLRFKGLKCIGSFSALVLTISLVQSPSVFSVTFFGRLTEADLGNGQWLCMCVPVKVDLKCVT